MRKHNWIVCSVLGARCSVLSEFTQIRIRRIPCAELYVPTTQTVHFDNYQAHTSEQCNKVICYSTNLFEKCVRRSSVNEWMFGVVGLVSPEYRNFICIRSNVGRWHGTWLRCWSFCCHGNVCVVYRLLSNQIIEHADNNISRFIYKLEFRSII